MIIYLNKVKKKIPLEFTDEHLSKISLIFIVNPSRKRYIKYFIKLAKLLD